MTAKDLKKGSIVEIRLNLSPEKMNQPVRNKGRHSARFGC
jgi:hypothetical protein